MDGKWKSFKYSEPFSRHNCAKDWVDDINNCRHDPIGLETAWATKWWPNRQFTFILSVTEANAVQARARATKETAMPTLDFWKKLAMRMIQNKIGDNGVAAASPKRTRASVPRDHVLIKRAKKEGKYSYSKRRFKECKTLYIPHPCYVCRKSTRDNCSCNPGHDLCRVWFGRHLEEHGH